MHDSYRLVVDLLLSLLSQFGTGVHSGAVLPFRAVIALGRAVHDSWMGPDELLSSDDDITLARTYVASLMTRGVEGFDFEELYSEGITDKAAAAVAFQCILACSHTGTQHLLTRLSRKVAAASNTPAEGALLPLMMLLDELMEASPSSLFFLTPLSTFYDVAFPLFLAQMEKQFPKESELEILLRPVTWARGGLPIQMYVSMSPICTANISYLNTLG